VDPVVAQKKQAFATIYMQLWGEPATDGYLTAAAKSGMNIWEFALRERQKPAYFTTKSGKDAVFGWVEKMAQAGL
jgi:hypothetical protein